jgi:hypothetical protein
VTAFWIFPFNILGWAADSAASAFVTAFKAYLHAVSFPFIDLSRAKYCTKFIRAIGHADIMIKYG